MKCLNRNILVVLFVLSFFIARGQLKFYAEPVKIPIFLSGNFGELRNNHFHTGIDLKTEKRIGVPIYSTAEGYVSRIAVSPAGYGNVMYIDHPNGTTSVYGHLDSFRADIAAYVKNEQYKKQSFALDIEVPKNLFKVARQEKIAASGNSGSSGGPHLHFEIRDTRTEHPIDPLSRNFNITDKTPPRIHAVQIYALSDNAHVKNTAAKKRFQTVAAGKGYHLTEKLPIPVYGEIGIAINAYDYLDGSANACGVNSVSIFVDDEKTFGYTFSRLSFSLGRYINSFIDFEDLQTKNTRFQKLWRERGNMLEIYDHEKNRGIITISDDKKHTVKITVSDSYKNATTLTFALQGTPKEMPAKPAPTLPLFRFDKDNQFESPEIEITCKPGTFYEDLYFDYSSQEHSSLYFSKLHKVHYQVVPVHKTYNIKIKTERLPDSLTSKAGIASIDKNGQTSFIGGKFEDGWIKADIRTFGNFVVAIDTVPPRISALSIKDKNALTETNQIRFSISDDFSGIKNYIGKINNQWVLFEFDAKRNLLTYKIDTTRLQTGQRHAIELLVTDNCNNQSKYEATFWK